MQAHSCFLRSQVRINPSFMQAFHVPCVIYCKNLPAELDWTRLVVTPVVPFYISFYSVRNWARYALGCENSSLSLTTNHAKEKYLISILGSSIAQFWPVACSENWISTAAWFKTILTNKRLLTKAGLPVNSTLCCCFPCLQPAWP